ncbi:MAG: hypothetical protein PVI22_11930 [Lysobacterales bacterium]|jgi:hypothetical protein
MCGNTRNHPAITAICSLFIAAPGLASSMAAGQPPPRTTQLTFTAIDSGDRIVLARPCAQGAVTITFVAVEAEPESAAEAEGTATRTATDDRGRTTITFLEGLPQRYEAVIRDAAGDEVRLKTGFVAPAIVTGGQGRFVLETRPGERPDRLSLSEQNANEAQSDWVASRQKPDGSSESAFDVSGLPQDACSDGAVDFTIAGAPPRRIAAPAVCLEYRMVRLMAAGQTVSLQARVEGTGDDTLLQFTFLSDESTLSVSRRTVTLSVGRINAGETLTEVTGTSAGGYALDATVRIVRD